MTASDNSTEQNKSELLNIKYSIWSLRLFKTCLKSTLDVSVFSGCDTSRNCTLDNGRVRATKETLVFTMSVVLKCLCSVLYSILLPDDLILYGVGIVLSVCAWVSFACICGC